MNKIKVGEFITIPAWNAAGQVIRTEAPWFGSDDAQRVLLQSSPADEEGKWYSVDPGQFELA